MRMRGKSLELGEKTLLMGILNLTPDSFSDGGSCGNVGEALARAKQMLAEGADIIDVGGESTRPGYLPISPGEEIARIIPLIEALVRETEAVVSVDTYKYPVAEAALAAGAHLVNDIWGLQYDKGEMARVVAHYGAGLVIMHNRRENVYPEGLIEGIHAFFRRSVNIADAAGIPRDRLIFDPGIGFGKDAAQNWEILRNLGAFRDWGPLLAGASRKRFLTTLTGDVPPRERDGATAALSVAAVSLGVDILRVHDIKGNKVAVDLADHIYRRTGIQNERKR